MSATTISTRGDVKVISLIGLAHFASHYFQLIIPPLFPFIKEEFGVSYAQLGLVMGAFFVASGICQVLAGFAVDRYGARRVLLVGLALVSAAIVMAGLSPSYALLLFVAPLAGIGNSVFHPADFSILNAKVERRRLGHAFSVHAIGGNLGWAAAPLWSVGLASAFGWRNALVWGGLMGLAVTVYMALQPELKAENDQRHLMPEHPKAQTHTTFALLMQLPILMCFGYFTLLSVSMVGVQTFAVPGLVALYQTPLVLATTALTAFLLGGAAGIFSGGFLAGRTDRHGLVAGGGMLACAAFLALLASGLLPASLLVSVLGLAGFALGLTLPSRDLLVRANTPAGATGRVYGFVYSGLDVGAIFAPVLFGWFLDHDAPRAVFFSVALAMVLTMATVATLPQRRLRAG